MRYRLLFDNEKEEIGSPLYELLSTSKFVAHQL